MTEPKTICVDFDQTICDSNYPALGPPKSGVREAMQVLRDLGYRLIISSCRSCGWNWDCYYPDTEVVPATERTVHITMKAWLDEHGIPYDILDDGTKGKVSASLYVDDKGFRFENDWPAVVEFVRSVLESK